MLSERALISRREILLVAAAKYMVDPRPEEEVLEEIARAVGSREVAERIASLVWRIAFGEGYTVDEWANLLKSLETLSPWECIWRFQELVAKGFRKRHGAPPIELSDREILRYACKAMSTG